MTNEQYFEHIRRIAWETVELTGDRMNRVLNDAVEAATFGLGERWNSAMNQRVRVLRLELREAMKTPPRRSQVVFKHGSRLAKLERAGLPDKGTDAQRRRSERSTYE